VTVIHAFLSRDTSKQDVPFDYRALTAISESSRLDTCATLRHLCRRVLSAVPKPPLNDPPVRHNTPAVSAPRGSASASSDEGGRGRAIPQSKHSRVKRPILARVVIAGSEDKPGQVAMVRARERQKKGSSKTTPTAISSNAQLTLALAASPPLPPRKIQKMTSRSFHPPLQMEHPTPLARCADSASSERVAIHPTRSTPRIDPLYAGTRACLPSLPEDGLARGGARWRRTEKPTPTLYSVESDSTQLGEIPLHKWSEPVDFDAMSMLNKEAVRNGWPLTELPSPPLKKRRGGIFGLFRRKQDDM
jgi:hypothetical protein